MAVLALAGAFLLHPIRARELFTFFGDGGCFVLGSVLMLTMYARADDQMRQEHLRWVCVAVGALAFMDAGATWCGDAASLPLGETTASSPSSFPRTRRTASTR